MEKWICVIVYFVGVLFNIAFLYFFNKREKAKMDKPELKSDAYLMAYIICIGSWLFWAILAVGFVLPNTNKRNK